MIYVQLYKNSGEEKWRPTPAPQDSGSALLVVCTWQEVTLECKGVSTVPPLPVSYSVSPPVQHCVKRINYP